ncbi:MAG: inositol monophosphatase, partial [Verrucomicrobia bacterium]
MKHYLDAAEEAARTAGKLLRQNFQRRQHVNAVAAHDIKLEIDVEAQELITKLLLKEFPGHALYGEEGVVGDQSSEHQWVVDPLDGTVNYFYGIPHFCVSIALRLRNEIMIGVIYDPIRQEMWSGQKGESSRLNGHPCHVSERADLAEAVISIGLAKTGETINANFPLLEQMIHRVRKCRV